jgi:hypothetical protein
MLLPALLLLLQSDKPLLTPDELLEMMREAVPAVERATGRTFREPVWARLSSRHDVQKALVDELLPQMKILEPEADAGQARDMAEATAGVYGGILVAKYAWKSGTIHLVEGTIRKMADALGQPELLEKGVLRVVITHELVHALDYQDHAIFDRFGDSKSAGELEIWNALSEGHAQHVTRRVFEAAGELASFEKYEKAILAGPPGMGETERYLANLMTTSLRLAYLDGRAFFDALRKSGPPTYVEDVFRKPPASKNVILKPERYYGAKDGAADFDPAPAFDAFAKEFGADWTRRTQELDQGTLRAAFGNFVDARKIEEVVEGVLEARVLVLNPKRAPQSKIVAAALMQTKSPAAAKLSVDVSVELSKAKDKALADGPIRIVKSEYATLALPSGGTAVLIRKTISVQDQEVPVASVFGSSGEFEYELILSNEEADDARITAMIERLLGGLRKK